MAINFYPRPGMVLICDYNAGFKKPEMVKRRPCVVISRAYQKVAVVVPLSSTEPKPFRDCHCELDPMSLPSSLRKRRSFAKCDMLSHVCFSRLDRIMDGKCPRTGKRIYVNHLLLPCDLEQIRQALRCILEL